MKKLKGAPRASMWQVLHFVVDREKLGTSYLDISHEFKIGHSYASVILSKLHGRGFLKRRGGSRTAGGYHVYTATFMGKRAVGE